ncbi:protein CYSTEINE-RICH TRANSMEMBRANE MODULE 11-like [Arachis stenosperma]|uniref:protein CYSTEINE-RICH TRANSMEMBRANE MODULE 11-like n=1 Tax=Arachis stenosperma TaxID=217475 RepID=UPI0025ACBFD1|nr:protein CYSTEINE-RICH TRANSMEMBRANE MODULE 11-like [Arachis stenosperma]
MSDPKYAYPYPAQGGYYQGPPVMAPPQYAAAPPPRRNTGFLEGWDRTRRHGQHLFKKCLEAETWTVDILSPGRFFIILCPLFHEGQ